MVALAETNLLLQLGFDPHLTGIATALEQLTRKIHSFELTHNKKLTASVRMFLATAALLSITAGLPLVVSADEGTTCSASELGHTSANGCLCSGPAFCGDAINPYKWVIPGECTPCSAGPTTNFAPQPPVGRAVAPVVVSKPPTAPPQGQIGCTISDGRNCLDNISGQATQSSQPANRGNIDTQGPRLELQPSLTNGKGMRLLIRAFDQSPILRSLTVSPCNEPGTTIPVTSDAAGMSAAIKLVPGPNCTQVTAVDAVGNKTSAQANMPYVFDINLTSAQLTPEGKIDVGGITHNSLFPDLKVNVHHCGVAANALGGMSQQVVTQKDGSLHAQLTPLLGPNDCIAATATDTQGTTIATQANSNIIYNVDLGPLIPMQDSKNPKVWYLAATPTQLPSNLDPDSFVMRGTQKLWPFRPFIVSADFTCEKLPDGTVVNGKTFSLVAKCVTINETGQAEVQYQIGDKSNGYFSPIQSISLDIPTSPPLADQALFYGFLMGSIFAAAALGNKVHSSYAEAKIRNRVGTMLKTADYARARAAVSKARVSVTIKDQLATQVARAEVGAIEEKVWGSLTHKQERRKSEQSPVVIAIFPDLLKLLARPQYLSDRMKDILTKYTGRLRDDIVIPFNTAQTWTEYVDALTTLSTSGPSNRPFALLRHVIDLQSPELGAPLWDEIVRGTPILAENLRHISLLHLIQRGRLFSEKIFRELVIPYNEFEFVIEALWDKGQVLDLGLCEEMARKCNVHEQFLQAQNNVRKKKLRQ